MSKDTEKAFVILYGEYKRLIKAGYSKADAIVFCGNDVYRLPGFYTWHESDVRLALDELVALGFLSKNVLDDVSLTPGGVQYMEEKPKTYFRQLISDMSDIAEIISLIL